MVDECAAKFLRPDHCADGDQPPEVPAALPIVDKHRRLLVFKIERSEITFSPTGGGGTEHVSELTGTGSALVVVAVARC